MRTRATFRPHFGHLIPSPFRDFASARAIAPPSTPLRGFANRTVGRAFRCAAAEEPTELNTWLSYNIQRSQSQRRKVRGDCRGSEKPNSARRHFLTSQTRIEKQKGKSALGALAFCTALLLLLPFLVGRLGLGRA